MPIITGPELLTWVGVRAPTPEDSTWADLCADAVTEAIYQYLDVVDPEYNIDTEPEIRSSAYLAAGELYRRRDAPFGTTGYVEPNTGALIRLARDYLESVRPILFRYKSIAGLVA